MPLGWNVFPQFWQTRLHNTWNQLFLLKTLAVFCERG